MARRKQSISYVPSAENPIAVGGTGLNLDTLNVDTIASCSPLDDEGFRFLVSGLEEDDDNGRRYERVKDATTKHIFTGAQLLVMIQTTESVKTRLRMVTTVAPHLSDPRAKADELTGLFRFSDEKAIVEAALNARLQTLNADKFNKSSGGGGLLDCSGGGGRGRGGGRGGTGGRGRGRGGGRGGRGRGMGGRAGSEEGAKMRPGSGANAMPKRRDSGLGGPLMLITEDISESETDDSCGSGSDRDKENENTETSEEPMHGVNTPSSEQAARRLSMMIRGGDGPNMSAMNRMSTALARSGVSGADSRLAPEESPSRDSSESRRSIGGRRRSRRFSQGGDRKKPIDIGGPSVREILAKTEKDRRDAATATAAADIAQAPGSTVRPFRTKVPNAAITAFRSPTNRLSTSTAVQPGVAMTPEVAAGILANNASPLASSPGLIMPRQIHSTNTAANMADALGIDVDVFLALVPEDPLQVMDDGHKIYSYRELLRRKYQRDYDGVAAANLENHLTDSEFTTVFKMDKSKYGTIPQWKRTSMKQKALLF